MSLQARFENEFSLIACLSSSTNSGVWYIDSGASSHMTGVRDYFSSLKEEMDLVIEMGNNAKCRATGHGTVTFQRESGKPLMVRDILYVPGMTKNLISVSTLEDRGYVVSFQDGRVYIQPKDSKTAKVIGVRREKLYKLQFELARALVSSACDMAELWHRRMTHLHHGALKVLKEIVTGLPDFSIEHHEVCKGCAMGKYTKTTFPNSDNRTRGILDLIHSDICGPMSSVSLSGYEYYVTFIDDHSRKTWIYFMKTKDKVFSRFQEFKALVENQTGRKIKTLRSDNGGEYTSKAFKDFCAGVGIKRELTVSYNPQQNGVAKGRTGPLLGLQRPCCMIRICLDSYGQRLATLQVYIQNKSPHRVLGRKTPEEVFTGKKLEIGHFRIFGCLVYCHVPLEKRTKLEATTEKGIFVGYSENSKAYRVYIPALRKTVVRRDVKFEEDRALRKAHGTVPTTTGDQELETQKEEETHVTGAGTSTNAQTLEQDEEQEAPPVHDTPSSTRRRKTRWVEQTLREAQEYVGAPRTSVRESRAPHRFSSYMALMSELLEAEPSSFQEASQQ
jgi:transposase InsO family protein